MKRFRRILLWAGLCLTAAAVLILVFLEAGPGEFFLRRGLEKALSGSDAGPASIATLRTNFWSYAELRGLNSASFQAAEIRAEFQLASLFAGKPRISVLTIEGLTWSFPEKTANNPGPGRAPRALGKYTDHELSLEILSLRDSAILIQGQPMAVSGDIQGLFLSPDEQHLERGALLFGCNGVTLPGSAAPAPLDVQASLALGSVSSSNLGNAEARLQVEIKQGSSFVKAEASLRKGEIDAVASADIPDLRTLAAYGGEKDLSGRLNFHARAQGPLSVPRVRGTVTAKAIRYHGFPLDSLNAEATLKGKDWRFSRLEARGELDLESLRSPFEVKDLGGKISYQLQASGSSSDPEGTLDLNLDKPRIGGLRLGQGRIRLSAKNRGVALDAFSMSAGLIEISARGEASESRGDANLEITVTTGKEKAKPHGSLRVKGRREIDGGYSFISHLENLDLAGFKGALPQTLTLNGHINADLNGSGFPTHPVLEGSVTVENFGFQIYPGLMALKDLDLRAELKNSVLTLRKLEALVGPNSVQAFGRLRFQGDKGSHFEAEISGPRTGSLSLSGSLNKGLKDIRISADHLNPVMFEPFALIASKLGGTLDAKLRLSGVAGQNLVKGYIDGSDLQGLIWIPGLSVRKGAGRLEFTGSQISLSGVAWEMNGGHVEMGGGVTFLPGGSLWNLKANLRGPRLPLPPWGEASFEQTQFEILSQKPGGPVLLTALLGDANSARWFYKEREFQVQKMSVEFSPGDLKNPTLLLVGTRELKKAKGEPKGIRRATTTLQGPWNSALLSLDFDPPPDNTGPKTGVK